MITNPEPGRPEHARLTPGLVAFMGLMVAPAVIATAIVASAWTVAPEVYAAERAAGSGGVPPSVAEWKTTVVSICPIH